MMFQVFHRCYTFERRVTVLECIAVKYAFLWDSTDWPRLAHLRVMDIQEGGS